MALRVLSPGAYSLLVDQGRPGSRGLGVPVGGPADRTSYALANAFVGNESGAVALEVALAGPTLEATEAHALALVGAPFAVAVNDHATHAGRTINLQPGDVLRLGTPSKGLRAYLAVPGGFDAPVCLRSRSAFAPISRGEELVCAASQVRGRFMLPIPATAPTLLRVLPGSHRDLFKGQDVSQERFTVANDADRQGMRLIGKPLTRVASELPSAPTCPGTIQVTNAGQLVVLGVDAQTIGGYPRLAHVIDADLDCLGQLRPGDVVAFRWVELAEAEEMSANRLLRLREWTTLIRLAASRVPEASLQAGLAGQTRHA